MSRPRNSCNRLGSRLALIERLPSCARARRCTANITVFRARNITAAFEPTVVQIHLLAGAGLQNFNPSPIILPDGTAGLLFNAKNDSHCCNCDAWAPCLAYATAPSIFGAPTSRCVRHFLITFFLSFSCLRPLFRPLFRPSVTQRSAPPRYADTQCAPDCPF